MSLFITFEGGEGSGKTVQAGILYKRLFQLAVPVVLTHEPGATQLGERIARLLKWAQDTPISPVTELLLFNASRAQLVTEIIKPELRSGKIVLCDRYVDSTIAYQGYGRGIELALVKVITEAGTLGIKPGLTFLLDIPVEEGLTRKKNRSHDRFERENIAFHQRVREGYLKLAAQEPERWLVVDSNQPKAKVEQIIWQRVREMLPSVLQ